MRKPDFNLQKITKYSFVTSFIFLIAFIHIPYLVNPTDINENTIGFEEKKIGNTKNLVNYPVQDSYPKLATLENDEMEIFSTGDQFEGYNLFILTRFSNVGGNYDLILAIVDMNGVVVKQKDLGTSVSVAYLPAKFINSTTVLYADLGGAKLWNFYSEEVFDLGFKGHHDYDYNSNNNTFFTVNRYGRLIDGTNYLFDYIEEYTTAGEKIWFVDTYDFVDETMWCPFGDSVSGNPDVTHSNTVFYDAEEDVIYLNCRNTNTFYKIDHQTGEKLWGLGEYGDFALFDMNSIQKDSLFYHAHSVEKVSENEFILFDNDYHNQENPLSRNSRILEITINDDTMTANETWSWSGGQDYYSYYWSDADYLPGGHRFGTFGTYEHLGNASIGARLVEVDELGNRVWELYFPRTPQYSYGIYRSDRIRFSPTISSPEDFLLTSSEEVEISWNVWYNFKTRERVSSSYNLYLDNIIVDSSLFYFKQFWRPTELTFNLGLLTTGFHNLTLEVFDDGGHSSTDVVDFYAGPFYIEREGPTMIELGVINSTITWSGESLSELDYNLTLDGVTHDSGKWLDSDILLDLNTILQGSHNITLNLLNDSLVVFTDTFLVTIYPAEAPVISSYPAAISIYWGDVIVLEWTVFDNTPDSLEICVNETLEYSEEWAIENYVISWEFQRKQLGNFNVTLVAEDSMGRRTITTTWVTVNIPELPVISDPPPDQTILWGEENVSLIWEVAFGEEYILWQNGSVFRAGEVSSDSVILEISEWFKGEWSLGTYNLTLEVFNTDMDSVSVTSWITIYYTIGDKYANSAVNTGFSYDEDNAIGAPDGEFAIVFIGYNNGHVTLDMGENEEILNGEGNDFTIHALGELYMVKVANSLSDIPTSLGTGNRTKSFDLSAIGFNSARYVIIEINAVEGTVEIDAVEAIYYNILETDEENPIIVGPEDFWVWTNQTYVSLIWEASDFTPMNFSVSIGGSRVQSGPWNGENINYILTCNYLGFQTIRLTLYDIFGNSAYDEIVVEVREALEVVETTETEEESFGLIMPILAIGLIVLTYRRFYRKRKE